MRRNPETIVKYYKFLIEVYNKSAAHTFDIYKTIKEHRVSGSIVTFLSKNNVIDNNKKWITTEVPTETMALRLLKEMSAYSMALAKEKKIKKQSTKIDDYKLLAILFELREVYLTQSDIPIKSTLKRLKLPEEYHNSIMELNLITKNGNYYYWFSHETPSISMVKRLKDGMNGNKTQSNNILNELNLINIKLDKILKIWSE